jgi:putative ABC transport system permease protein
MSVRDLLACAWTALRSYRLRSSLTVLGVAWGVAAFVVLVSAARGTGEGLERSAALWGRNVVWISPGTATRLSGAEGSGREIRFLDADVALLRRRADLAQSITPIVRRSAFVERGSRGRLATLMAVEPEAYVSLVDLPLEAGRGLDGEDLRLGRRVIVLGSELAAGLRGRGPIEGRSVSVDGVTFLVVGALARRGPTAGNSLDRQCFVPLTAVRALGQEAEYSSLLFRPRDLGRHRLAIRQVVSLLAQAHGFSPDDGQAVVVRDRVRTLRTFERMTASFNAVWGLIGAVTLAIGGVGLANIVLVSVNERIREIGVRRALGAKSAEIRNQFLVEALVIALAGGGAGVLLAAVICAILPPLSLGSTTAEFSLAWPSVLSGLVLLTVVAIAAGLWPARRAARISVSEALRVE